MSERLLETYIKEFISEARLAETEVTTLNGDKVKYGSPAHIKDIEQTIRNLIPWRDRQRRGSAARAEYAGVINRLKGALKSAQKASEKNVRSPTRKPKADKVRSPETAQMVKRARVSDTFVDDKEVTPHVIRHA